MNSVILTPMARGQITLPKKFRDKLGITSDTPLSVTMRKNEIVVKSLTSRPKDFKYVIKPKYTRSEYKKILVEISDYIKKHGPLWTEEDDKRKAESLKKEREKQNRLYW